LRPDARLVVPLFIAVAFAAQAFAASDTAAPSAKTLAYADAALDSLHLYALRRDSVDWDTLRAGVHRSIAGARVPSDTYVALALAAHSVDRHSGLLPPDRMRALGSETPGAMLPPLEPPRAQWLEERVGYLALPGMVGNAPARQTEYADVLQRALAEQDSKGACGWIVDLRSDVGGNCYPMLAGVGPLLGADTSGWFEDRAVRRSAWRYGRGRFFVDSGRRDTTQASASLDVHLRAALPPVAVLIGHRTASSGEVVATAFRGRPNTRFFGQPTAGYATGNRLIKLSDGAALNITSSAYLDRTGRRVNLLLLPDEFLPEGAAGPGPDDAITRAALAWLRTQAGCGGK
jgi:hypothetical protein